MRMRLGYSVAVVVVLALASSCAQSHSGGSDGESHFLTSCEASCEGGLTCICGVCTRVCDETDDCNGLAGHPTCVAPDRLGAARQCGSNDPADESVCDVPCSTDGECTELGDAFSCQASFCRDDGYRPQVIDGGRTEASRDAGVADVGAAPDAGPVAAPPQEPALRDDYTRAQASEDFIFIPDPDNGEVIIVDPLGLGVRRVEVLERPTYLAAYPHANRAVVLDEGSERASFIRASYATVRVESVEGAPGANAVAFAPDGDHAIIYFDPRFVGGERADGAEREISVLEFVAGLESATRFVMGPGASPPFFGADSFNAVIKDDEGLSIIDLTDSPPTKRTVDFGNGVNAEDLEVRLTPWCRYALGFEPQGKTLRWLDTSTEEFRSLDMEEVYTGLGDDGDGGATGDAGFSEPPFSSGGEVPAITDVAVHPDGSFALVLLQNVDTLLRFDLLRGFYEVVNIQVAYNGELGDSLVVAPDGRKALLFDTAGRVRRMTMLDMEGESDPQDVSLFAPVDSVAFRSGISHAAVRGLTRAMIAVLVHDGVDPSSESWQGGFTVLAMDTGTHAFAAFVGAPEDPRLFEIYEDAGAVFMAVGYTEWSEGRVYRANFDSELTGQINLDGMPFAIGSAAGVKRVFVHHDGGGGQVVVMDLEGEVTGSLPLSLD